MWIAVGDGTYKIATSIDGINWTGVNTSVFNGAEGVAYNSLRPNTITFPTNRIVAVGSGGNQIVYSPDGNAWTAVTPSPFSTQGTGVAWNGSIWVAVGVGAASNNSIAYSLDNGISWLAPTTWTNPFSSGGNGIAWNGSMWVAVGTSATYNIANSSDGINWTSVVSPFTTSGNSVAWDGIKWIAVGQGTQTMATSSDGITWTSVPTTPFTTSGNGIAWNGSMWVAVGSSGGAAILAHSTDGILTWTIVTLSPPFSTQGKCVAWNGSMWVAGGDSGGNGAIAYSTTGTIWTMTVASVGTMVTSLAWIGTNWVAFGGNVESHSPDGITWTNAISSPFTTSGLGVAWNSGKGSVKIKDVSGILSLNSYGPGLSNKLDVVSSEYYNKGFNNFSVRFK
jgi:hypothetical protein